VKRKGEWRYAWIFAAAAISAIIQPGFPTEGRAPFLLWLVAFFLILASVRAVWADRRLLIAVGVFGILHLFLQVAEEMRGHPSLLVPLTDVSGIALFALAACGILLDILTRDEITADTVFGASAVYLLLGSLFARAYMLIEFSAPGAFAVSPALVAADANFARDPQIFHYFSLVTLTTMGYGDITPVKAIARSVASLEAVLGQLYVAVIVARFVAIYSATHRSLRPRS
jgi:hypothetical protein